jgi:hypothetical protein
MAAAMQAIRFLLLPGLGLLSACGGGTVIQSTPAPSRLAPPPQLHRSVPGLRIQNLPGLEGVIGATRTQLARQFGAPRLDVIEGDVRKLQFTGAPCVLDVYLYPAAPGLEPEAAYVDARSANGRDVDRAGCVAALRRPVAK